MAIDVTDEEEIESLSLSSLRCTVPLSLLVMILLMLFLLFSSLRGKSVKNGGILSTPCYDEGNSFLQLKKW